jgi:hypothetical protein
VAFMGCLGCGKDGKSKEVTTGSSTSNPSSLDGQTLAMPDARSEEDSKGARPHIVFRIVMITRTHGQSAMVSVREAEE